jgi:hypothetical protein
MAQNTMDAILKGSNGYVVSISTMPFTSDETVNLPLTPEYQTGIVDAATIAAIINQPLAILEIDSLGQNSTLNLTITTNLQKGALLFIKMVCGATPYNLILGTGTDGSTVRGLASATKWVFLTYNGTAYQLISENAIGSIAGTYETLSLSATGTQALTVAAQSCIIDGVTTQATGNRTLNLTIGSTVKAGSLIHLKTKTAATETTVFGTGFTAPTITGVAGKTFTQSFYYDGTAYKPCGTSIQID